MVWKGESTLTSHCLVWKQGVCGCNWEWSRMREPKRDGLWAEAPHSGTSLGQRNLEDGLLIMKNPRSTGKYCLKLTKELWKWKVWRFTEVPPIPHLKETLLKALAVWFHWQHLHLSLITSSSIIPLSAGRHGSTNMGLLNEHPKCKRKCKCLQNPKQ